MEYFRQRNTVVSPELARFIPFNGGATWSMLWKVLYYTRLLKYVHWEQYKKINKNFTKICRKDNLYALCETGLLKSPATDVFITTNKALPILKEAGFPTETLPKESTGKGDINELNNTEAFIGLMKQPHFYTLLYPNFSYLIPDALLVLKDEVNRRYKLTFIEVERKKPEWEDYIATKIKNYDRLSVDIEFYSKWQEYSELLGLPKPDISKVKFNYTICRT